ncbi:MAG: hypothetical protein NWF04_05760 [Candidatus Bathyarchaeota archaeon]|nr:hypothetical protein [Candidatus Bathyarchaeota archaeon]
MLPVQEEDTQVLTQLGLTAMQAKVYLTLAKLGKATIKKISNSASLDRANVYRVMPKLQKLKLVEKTITVPNFFKAVPMREGISMLLEHKAREYQEIEDKTKTIIEKYKENVEDSGAEDCQFVLVPEGRATGRKMAEMRNRSQCCYDFLFYWKSGVQIIDHIVANFKRLMKRGITVRALIYLNKGETLTQNILNLEKNKLFSVRYTFTSLPVTLALFDKKETLFNTAPFCPAKTPSLWANNPVLIDILQEYFEQRWCKAQKPPAKLQTASRTKTKEK